MEAVTKRVCELVQPCALHIVRGAGQVHGRGDLPFIGCYRCGLFMRRVLEYCQEEGHRPGRGVGVSWTRRPDACVRRRLYLRCFRVRGDFTVNDRELEQRYCE